MNRKYDILRKNCETGHISKLNKTPMSHTEACVFKSKHTEYFWAVMFLQEVENVKFIFNK